MVDASALLGLLLGDPSAAQAFEELAELASVPLHAPALVELEALNGLRRLVQRGHVSDERAQVAVTDLGRTRRVLYPHGPFRDRIWELRDELTAYDAAYLALAERLGGSLLVTGDRGLGARARRSLGGDRVRLI